MILQHLYRSVLFVLLFVFATSIIVTSNIQPVSAQSPPFKNDAEGMTLSPPSFEMTLDPGTETAYTIRITNPTKNLVELYPSAGNFSASGEGGEPKYEIGDKAIENDSRYSIASWVGFFEPKIAILPEQVVDFRFRIKVPQGAEPGGHYGVVFLGTKPPEDKGPESQVALSTMVGSLLLVRVPGDVRESLDMDEFSAPWFFFSSPVDFNILLRNTGNVHARPMGDVTITDWRGRSRERLEINRVKGSVLPDSRREFNVSWKPDTPYFWTIPIGKFHATLKAVYGEEHHTLERTVSFWIIPWWIIIAVGFSFLFLLIFITFIVIRKRRQKRLLQRKNAGFFPAFGRKKSLFETRGMKSDLSASETNWEARSEIHQLAKEDNTQESALHHMPPISLSGNYSTDKPYNNTVAQSFKNTTIQPENHSASQQFDHTAIQRIRESNKKSKQSQQTEASHFAPEPHQTPSTKSKKRRFV